MKGKIAVCGLSNSASACLTRSSLRSIRAAQIGNVGDGITIRVHGLPVTARFDIVLFFFDPARMARLTPRTDPPGSLLLFAPGAQAANQCASTTPSANDATHVACSGVEHRTPASGAKSGAGRGHLFLKGFAQRLRARDSGDRDIVDKPRASRHQPTRSARWLAQAANCSMPGPTRVSVRLFRRKINTRNRRFPACLAWCAASSRRNENGL
jgi:hypothetical protein